jgi:UDP-4-amino-4,6-dideoxy-N-acetyl-beta-L-altrosamine transaminase
MTKSFLPYGRHQIDESDILAVNNVLRSDYLTTGFAVSSFERSLAETTGSKHAVVCSSGTAALHLASMSLNIKSGDTVIVPAITFLSTANAVRFTGAEVIFSDVNPDTGIMEVEHISEAINRLNGKHPKAVFPVDLNGVCSDIVSINDMSQQYGFDVVVDSCHSIGGSYSDSKNNIISVGSNVHSLMTCFSFHPVKTIAMGEGGAITTNNTNIANKLLKLRNHGITRNSNDFTEDRQAFSLDGIQHPWYYEMNELGFNYRASDINCALGESQLKKIKYFVERRRYISNLYDELLKPLAPIVNPPVRVSTSNSAWHIYPVRIDYKKISATRDRIVHNLFKKGIGTQVHYLPVNRQPYYLHRYGDITLKGANSYYDSVLSLPIFPNMKDDDVMFVVKSLAGEIV